jgi:preprotein translocase subunit SecD
VPAAPSPVVASLLLAMAVSIAACGDDTREARTEATGGDEVELTYKLGDGLSSEEVSRLTEILENRIDALGIDGVGIDVGDGEVRLTIAPGPNIDLERARELIGVTAELRFRPVLLALSDPEALADLAVTSPADDRADVGVVLDGDPAGEVRYQLGPTTATGSIIESADAQLDGSGQWVVAIVLTPDGVEQFNELAAQCFGMTETCPTGQVAIVLDSAVRSAPTIQQPSFERDQIQVSGLFTEDDAKALALVLRYGSLPTSLTLTSMSP